MKQAEPFLQEISRNSNNQNWLIVILILITLAYVLVRLIYGKYWRRYRQAIFYGQEAQKLIHEKNVLLLQAAVILNVLAIFSISLFLFILVSHFQWIDYLPEKLYGWGLTIIFVGLITGAKYLVIRLLGSTGDNKKVAVQINHQWLINMKNFGFFLLPVSAASAFISPSLVEPMLFLGLAVVGFMLILNYIKGFLILLQHRISIYYGILYLCTLEILPVLILVKVIRFTME